MQYCADFAIRYGENPQAVSGNSRQGMFNALNQRVTRLLARGCGEM
ncbi:hypothetical protein RBA69_01890 [Brenneria goodwinii]